MISRFWKKLIFWKKKPQAPRPVNIPSTSPTEAELLIDLYVKENLAKFPNLVKFKNDLSFWQNHFKAKAFAESSFNQTETYVEDLGTDAVTKKPNTSEGFFQMSYQDALYHGCKFDWSADKNKSLKDKSKTIFNIERNLECAMIVMNKQIEKRGVIYTDNNPYYWSVLDKANKRHSVYLSKLNSYKPSSNVPVITVIDPPAKTETQVINPPVARKPKFKKIAVIIGHGAGDSGAVGAGTNEFAYNSIVANDLIKYCPEKEIKLFFRDSRGISGVNSDAEKWGGDLTIELHLNSFNTTAKGCEVLVLSKDEASIKLGQSFADEFCKKYFRIKRDTDGVKELKKGDRGHYSLLLVDDPAPSILIEPFFIDNPSEWIPPQELSKFLANWLNNSQ